MAEFWSANPQALWQATRALAGRYSALLPANLALGLTRVLELPADLLGALDVGSPVLGVLLESEVEPRIVLAFHVRSGRELVVQLSAGKAPPFRALPAALGVTELQRVQPGPAHQLAVYKNYLLISSPKVEARSAARYLVDVVAARKNHTGHLVVTAREPQLKGAVSTFVRNRFRAYQESLSAAEQRTRSAQAGRAPDFGEPAAVQAALASGGDAVSSLLDSTRQLTLEVIPGPDIWSFRMELVPKASGAAHDLVAEQALGSSEPLARLPDATALAVMLRSTPKQRLATAMEVVAQLKALFAQRLTEREQAELSRGLSQLATGRGDVTVVGLVLGTTPGLIFQGETQNREPLQQALTTLPPLLRSEAVTQPLAAFLGPLRLSPLRGASAGNPVNGYRLALGQGGRFASLTPAEFSMSWQVDDASYHVAFSAPVGSSLLEASQNPVRRWGESAPIRAALKRVGPASFVLVALPSALGMSPTSPAATMTSALVLSAGRSGEAGYASVEAPVSLLSAELESMVQQ